MILETIFSKNEIKKFMINSGDRNPIHHDVKYASRQIFGNTVIHGSLVVERFIDYYFKKKNYEIKEFNCSFTKPVFVNEKIKYIYKDSKNSIFCTVFNNMKEIVAIIRVVFFLNKSQYYSNLNYINQFL